MYSKNVFVEKNEGHTDIKVYVFDMNNNGLIDTTAIGSVITDAPIDCPSELKLDYKTPEAAAIAVRTMGLEMTEIGRPYASFTLSSISLPDSTSTVDEVSRIFKTAGYEAHREADNTEEIMMLRKSY